jgi:hypothetical protein
MLQTIELSKVAQGKLEDLFQQAFHSMLENSQDPNTLAKARRRVTITVDLVVDEARSSANLKLGCTTKLAPTMPIVTPVRIGQHMGITAAIEAFPQEEMFPTPAGKPSGIVQGGVQ